MSGRRTRFDDELADAFSNDDGEGSCSLDDDRWRACKYFFFFIFFFFFFIFFFFFVAFFDQSEKKAVLPF